MIPCAFFQYFYLFIQWRSLQDFQYFIPFITVEILHPVNMSVKISLVHELCQCILLKSRYGTGIEIHCPDITIHQGWWKHHITDTDGGR